MANEAAGKIKQGVGKAVGSDKLNKFRGWCDQAGLRHWTAHGLRKAGATIAANNGATSRQLMAIFGWDSIRMAEQFTRSADQQRLADDAMHLIEARDIKS